MCETTDIVMGHLTYVRIITDNKATILLETKSGAAESVDLPKKKNQGF